MISTCELGQTRGSAPTETPFCRGNPLWLPPARRGAHVENLLHRHLPIARAEFTIAHLLQVPPRFARGTAPHANLRTPISAKMFSDHLDNPLGAGALAHQRQLLDAPIGIQQRQAVGVHLEAASMLQHIVDDD